MKLLKYMISQKKRRFHKLTAVAHLYNLQFRFISLSQFPQLVLKIHLVSDTFFISLSVRIYDSPTTTATFSSLSTPPISLSLAKFRFRFRSDLLHSVKCSLFFSSNLSKPSLQGSAWLARQNAYRWSNNSWPGRSHAHLISVIHRYLLKQH